MRVAALGRATLDGLAAGGVAGVIKHIPGHGRARADSHKELPIVDAPEEELAADLAPFRALHDAPMAMTAHILYTAWDAERPATLSPTIIADIIRARIGFDGLLMSDDLDMEALSGTLADAPAAAIAAGCDVALHCSGVLAESEEVAGAAGRDQRGGRRAARPGDGADRQGFGALCRALAAKRDALLAMAAAASAASNFRLPRPC